MSTSQQKSRDSRKAKTSILFQIKQNTQQNIEVGQSMNIISLNNPLKNRTQIQDNIINKNQYSFNKTHLRRIHQSGKLTIKIGGQPTLGNNLSNQDENGGGKGGSVHSVGARKLGVGEIIEKFQKRNLIQVDRNRVVSDLSSFTSICLEFMQKIDTLQLQNTEMSTKLKKYQNYFKQLKSKEPYQSECISPPLGSPSNTRDRDRTSQLKILNLQRKVETLTYIIKNYRSNNKEQLKQFQKKIHQYKPTIQTQLTQMLAQANRKYEDIAKVVEYFQKQCAKYCKEGSWVQLVRGLKEKHEVIERLEAKIKEIEEENLGLKNQQQANKEWKEQLDILNKEVMQANFSINEITKKLEKTNQQKLDKQNEYYELLQSKQELSFKLQALIPLESKIKDKQQIIRKNSLAIARLQSENNALKNKIGSIVKNFQTEYFNKQSASIETIEKCSTTIEQLASRFFQQIQGMPQFNKQMASFISHLFDKTKMSFQKMIQEYRMQIQTVCMENKELKTHLNSMISLNQRKFECCQEIIKDIENIESKRKRCQQSQARIDLKQNCQSCLNWVLHWGQLNNLYNQMTLLVNKLREVE